MHLTKSWRPIMSVGDTIYGWRPGLHSFLCFLAVDAVWPAALALVALTSLPWGTVRLNCETESTWLFLKLLLSGTLSQPWEKWLKHTLIGFHNSSFGQKQANCSLYWHVYLQSESKEIFLRWKFTTHNLLTRMKESRFQNNLSNTMEKSKKSWHA